MREYNGYAHERIEQGKICYVSDELLSDVTRAKSTRGRIWCMDGTTRTLQIGTHTLVKSLSGFRDDLMCDVNHWGDVIEQCVAAGVKRPASYSSIFHALHSWPRPIHSAHGPIGRTISGGWEQAFRSGIVRRPVWCYDINSAYCWAVSLGLPHPRKLWRAVDPAAVHDGVFFGRWNVPRGTFPLPIIQDCIWTGTLSKREMEVYGVVPVEIYWGVSWSRESEIQMGGYVCNIRNRFTFWKAIFRSFWGAWICSAEMREKYIDGGVIYGEKDSATPNKFLNYLWGHLTISRVKTRVWRAVQDYGAVRVYTDSVAALRPMADHDIGFDIGQFRLDKFFPACNVSTARILPVGQKWEKVYRRVDSEVSVAL